MVTPHLESALTRVERSWNAKVRELDVVAQELLIPPAWHLSRILLGTALLGSEIDEDVVAACRALEFLEQALRLGRATGGDPDKYIENHLLITDYLYAQAIDQVIFAGRPRVIGWLAQAIMMTAQDRVDGDFGDHHPRLIAAALEIGCYLGGVNGAEAEAVAAAVAGAGSVDNGQWIELLPAGPIRDYMRRSLATVHG